MYPDLSIHNPLNNGLKNVNDPIITGFGIKMLEGGFLYAESENGQDILRVCPECRNGYSTLFIKEEHEFWGCPNCDSIKKKLELVIKRFWYVAH